MMKIRILYEDNHIIGVEKPCGVLSQSDGSDAPDMLTILANDIRERYNKPGNAFVGLVHRLDRNVGGAMLFAKTSKGASRLSEQMRNGRFFKGYLALTDTALPSEEGFLRNRLLKDEKSNTVRESKEGKDSVLFYSLAASCSGCFVYFVIPITGRTHQIRAQFAFAGSPLFGDSKYGRAKGGREIGLWSVVCECAKPTNSEESVIIRSVPHGSLWNSAPKDKIESFIENIDVNYYKNRCKENV